MDIQSNFIEVHDVTDAGKLLREFFLNCPPLSTLLPYREIRGKKEKQQDWASEAEFYSADINFLLGRAAEQILPRKVVNAITQLSIGKFPRVIHLKGMPVGEIGDRLPEKDFPHSAMSLRAISALLAKSDRDWSNAYYSRF